MTVVIKSTDVAALARVRPIPADPPPPQLEALALPRQDGALTAARAQIAELAGEVEARDAQLQRLRDQAESARRAGEATGRLAGLKEAETNAAQNLAKLERGIELAVEQFTAALASLERLAPALAREGLAKVLGDPELQASFVSAIVAKQVRRLDGAAVVRIEVSRQDFPREAALSELAAAIDRPALELIASDTLGAGDCRIKLRLGAMEVGVAQQWARLDTLLAELAGAEPAA